MHFSTTTTSALLTLLAASVVRAEELNSSDVPTACSAICAPIVTLTSICDVDPATEGSNQLVLAQLSSPNVMDKGGEKRSLYKRRRLTSSGALASSFKPANGKKEKRGRLLSTGELADAFDAKNGRKQKRGRLMSSGALSSAFENNSGKLARMVKREDDDDDKNDGNGGVEGDEAIEADCVCKNTSFDVAMIGGLCAGCLAGNGGVNEDMSTIMSQCGFTTSSYAETATAMVANVTVVATKPTRSATGSATGSVTGTAATGTTSTTSTSTAGTGSGAAAMTRVAGWILGVGAVMAWML